MKERPRLWAGDAVNGQQQEQLHPTTTLACPQSDLPIEPLLTPDDLARILQCTRRTVERMRSGGLIPAPDLLLGVPGKKPHGRFPRWRAQTIRQWIKGGQP